MLIFGTRYHYLLGYNMWGKKLEGRALVISAHFLPFWRNCFNLYMLIAEI